MKVLFVISGNSKFHHVMPPFIRSQANSLIEKEVELDFFQITGKGVSGYLKNIIPLRQKIRKHGFDVIHAHYGFCGVVAALSRRKEKLVVSFMGESEFIPDPEDRFNPFIWFMLILHRIFARFVFDYVIFKSSNLSNFINGIDHKSSIIPNGVDLETFKPLDKLKAREFLNLPQNRKIVLWIGNSERPVKNYSLAYDSVEIVREFFPELLFLPVNNVPNDLLYYYYNAADVFLLSSLNEGSPNVVKESMACNCPVVATNVGDVKWLFDSEPGNFISSLSLSDFSDKLKLALDYARDTGNCNGRNRIISLDLGSSLIADRLIKIYKSVLLHVE